jgi:hypothetical protein
MTYSQDDFSSRAFFRDWPNESVPAVAAGVYAVWDGSKLIYVVETRT